MIVKIQKGVVTSSLSLFDPAVCGSKGKRRVIDSDYSTMTNLEQKQHSVIDVRKRSHKILTLTQSINVEHQGFITLLSNVNDSAVFRKQFDSFALWFSRVYRQGWLFYVFELCSNSNIHVHMFFHTGLDKISLDEFEVTVRRKWAVVQGDGNPSLTMVTPYHESQRGYFSKWSKIGDSIRLLNLFQTSKTFGFISKKNVSFVKPQFHEIDEEKAQFIQRVCLRRVEAYDAKMKRMPSYPQINRIISGSFAQHCVSEIDIACIHYCLYFEQLAKMYEVDDSINLDGMEWPSMEGLSCLPPDHDDDDPSD